MAESKYETAIAALKTRLQAIVGDSGSTRWYTPTHVLEYPAFTAECVNALPNAIIYVISPDDEPIEAGTLKQDHSKAIVDLSLAQWFQPQSEDPFTPPTVHRRLLQSRMAQDVLAALASDRTLSGACHWINFLGVNRRAEDTVFGDKPWAVVFVRIEIELYYTDTTP